MQTLSWPSKAPETIYDKVAQLKWTLAILAGIAIISFTFAAQAAPSVLETPNTGLSYFSSGISFWGEEKSEKQMKPESSPEQEKTFPWDTYLDPRNKEFFKEGDYTPPEAFMEVVRNPTDQNLKNWVSYIQKKNELMRRFQKRLEDYSVSQRGMLPAGDQSYLESISKPVAKNQVPIDSGRYRFRMYFDSTCPHCKHMFQTLLELKELGFFVEAKQIDSAPLVNLPLLISRATPNELKQKEVKSVPLLFVGDLRKKVVFRMPGYQSTADLLERIKSRENSIT